MTYGKEDTDYRTEGNPSSGYVFNAAESVFFCRVRDLMVSDLRKLYISCESKNCWSATSLINEFDSKQNEWPEELWRVDYVRKYERTYRNGNTRFLEQMMNGKKKYQRRQFERDQEIYMATKFVGNKAASDQIMFRCNTPISAVVKPDYTLHLTPFSNMYLSVMFGNASSVTQIRAKAGQQYSISCPYTTMDDTAVLIYAASRIQSMGDISACYIHDNDFSKAEKMKELIIGNTTAGYSNEFLTNLVIGNNRLLEKLDVRNTPNLASSLDLSKCGNLKELYATGSGLTGVLFANGGKVQTALLPDTLTSINMRNLKYLDNLNIAGYDQITTAIIENCDTIDSANLLNKATKLNRARIIGVNWSLENTTLLDRLYKMGGLDKNGYNVEQSIVTGSVHVPVMKEKLLAQYHEAWPDLEITYNTLVQQFTVTFKNDNGDILDVQYVDKGTKAVDPLTRAENPITTPTKESTVSTDYTFAGWDKALVDAFEDQVITATYSETTRNYTIKYVSNNTVLQETSAPYGSSVLYEGEIPTYTAEESAYKYYLFSGWDQGGYVNGDKTINAVYDSCEYKEGYFVGKEIADMRPVELYMMTKLGLAGIITLTDYVSAKDALTIQLGNDFSYSDIEEQVLISDKTVFNGSNYVDTGVTLLSEDRDFVLAIDCKMDSGNSNNAVLAQCFSGLDTSGFKLTYNSGIKLLWGSSSATPFSVNNREMIVLRHIKGENGIYVYSSNTTGDSSYYVELSGIHSMVHNVSLVFGCSKLEDGSYENYGLGTVYWSKVWYADLGDAVCKKIAYWPHESINFEACCESNGSMKRYYLSDNSGARSSITFISSQTLTHPAVMDTASTNAGGWASFALNNYLNSRVYEAFPDSWKQLMKQVKVKSSIGEKSLTVSSSDCYVFIPSISELVPSMTAEPYGSEGTAISHFTSNDARVCYNPEGVAVQYWTRSPSIDWNNYVFRISITGAYQAVTQLSAADVYPRIMINI